MAFLFSAALLSLTLEAVCRSKRVKCLMSYYRWFYAVPYRQANPLLPPTRRQTHPRATRVLLPYDASVQGGIEDLDAHPRDGALSRVWLQPLSTTIMEEIRVAATFLQFYQPIVHTHFVSGVGCDMHGLAILNLENLPCIEAMCTLVDFPVSSTESFMNNTKNVFWHYCSLRHCYH